MIILKITGIPNALYRFCSQEMVWLRCKLVCTWRHQLLFSCEARCVNRKRHAHGLWLSRNFRQKGISLSPERERKRERAPSSSLDIFVSFISYSDVVCSMEYYSQRYSRNVTIRYLLYTITCVLCVRRADLADSRKLGEYDDVLVVHVRDEIHLNEPRGNHFRAFHKASASSLYNSTSYWYSIYN